MTISFDARRVVPVFIIPQVMLMVNAALVSVAFYNYPLFQRICHAKLKSPSRETVTTK